MEKKKQAPKTSRKQDDEAQGRTGLNDYLKYAGMGFQMLAIIGIFSWVGIKLDQRAEKDSQIYTAILALLGVIVGIYTVLKDFIRKENNE